MTKYIKVNSIQVEETFYNFVCNEVLEGTGLDTEKFWTASSHAISKLDQENKLLLVDRRRIQGLFDNWNDTNKGLDYSLESYKEFLTEIGYLKKEGPDFEILTKNVDPEICLIAGPQLVVPVTNPRYALNAANARWGSLYDAIYGTDVLDSTPRSKSYDVDHGQRVIEWVRGFLDQSIPINNSSWSDVTHIELNNNVLRLKVNERTVELMEKTQFRGSVTTGNGVKDILFCKNDLHIIVSLDSNHIIGSVDKASIADVVLESAISVIMDCEDSVATVDAEDKIVAYKNWLGLMQGTLKETINKNGKEILRCLADDKIFTDWIGKKFFLKGRSLMLVRNVGHLMTTSLVLDENGREVGEGLIDCLVTAACGIHDLSKRGGPKNSETGSIYIVKPKMHGPDEVAFTEKLFDSVEKILLLPKDTIKLGIMDEERRTSLNLKECIRESQSRVAFINTGFLDRTGDEIHTSMKLGAMVRKADMKKESWIDAYEKNNVQVGLQCGFHGKAQIGKGMWAMPDKMGDMLREKINHPNSGGTCAWVPSPTAATIHAIHYHQTSVNEVQQALFTEEEKDYRSNLLEVPISKRKNWSETEIKEELLNNVQGILGYVVRWIDQGIGCSKVPDINGIGLMEDRATCRISSQHIANWLYHGIISEDEIISAFKKMAVVVDTQNYDDELYCKMASSFDGFAFRASQDLAILGQAQPSGYTEPLLHKYRKKKKAHGND